MPEVTATTFDRNLDAWRQWQDAPWGRLRYTVAEHNLNRHLDGRPLKVLDVAGGNGVEAVRLAEQGHRVTLVDHSPKMLASARSLAAATAVGNRITFVESDVARVGDVVEPRSYDLVLCHNLLPYVADLEATLATVLATVRDDGLLSIIAGNAHSETLRTAIRDMDLTSAHASLNAKASFSATFGARVFPRTAEQVSAALRRLGAGVLGHYGIRTVCDYIPDDERKFDASFFADLERLELAMSRRMPYVLTARLFHLVASAPAR